ncbi:MAG: hypothetical protein ACI9AR_000175 [Flavobacteriaceae bacterium]|jgi:hypothetical protein
MKDMEHFKPKKIPGLSEKGERELEEIIDKAVSDGTVESFSAEKRALSIDKYKKLTDEPTAYFELASILKENIKQQKQKIINIENKTQDFLARIEESKKSSNTLTEAELDVLMHTIAEAGALILEYKGEKKNLNYLKEEIEKMTEQMNSNHERIQEIKEETINLEIQAEILKNQKNADENIDTTLN